MDQNKCKSEAKDRATHRITKRSLFFIIGAIIVIDFFIWLLIPAVRLTVSNRLTYVSNNIVIFKIFAFLVALIGVISNIYSKKSNQRQKEKGEGELTSGIKRTSLDDVLNEGQDEMDQNRYHGPSKNEIFKSVYNFIYDYMDIESPLDSSSHYIVAQIFFLKGSSYEEDSFHVVENDEFDWDMEPVLFETYREFQDYILVTDGIYFFLKKKTPDGNHYYSINQNNDLHDLGKICQNDINQKIVSDSSDDQSISYQISEMEQAINRLGQMKTIN